MFDEKQLKICDMGIVVKREYVNGVEVATMHKNAKTPMYMSPEQVRMHFFRTFFCNYQAIIIKTSSFMI